MSGIGGFKGVSADQDARFSNKQKKLMKSMKFPKELDLKVDPTKVNWAVMMEWVAKRVTELLGVEDEVLIQFIHNKLQEKKMPEAKELHIDLIPFLEKNTSLFMKELWELLASASCTASGIPQEILDSKAEELRKRKELQEKNEELRLQRKRDRDAEQDPAPSTEQRSRDDNADHDRGNQSRWARGRNDMQWRSRDSRGRGGRFHGGRRFAPYSRERPRPRENRSPRRRSRSPPRKFSKFHSKSSKFSQARSQSPYRKGSRSPHRNSPKSGGVRESKRHGSASPPRYHGKGKHQSPIEKSRGDTRTRPEKSREANPERSPRSDSPPRSDFASPVNVNKSEAQPKNRPNASAENGSGGDEDKSSGIVENAGGAHSPIADAKQKKPSSGHALEESPIRSGALKSPTPKSQGSLDQSPERSKKRANRPSLNSSISSKDKSSPRNQGHYRPRSPLHRYQSPRRWQNGRESNRFPPRPLNQRRDFVSQRSRDFSHGQRSSCGKPRSDFDGQNRRSGSQYEHRSHGIRGGRGRSSGGQYDSRPRQGDQEYWRGSRAQSPIRERRTGYAYRGVSPQSLKKRVEVQDKSQLPARPARRSHDKDVELEKTKSGPQTHSPRTPSVERNPSEQGGNCSGGEEHAKRGKKRKKEKKSKSKKHKKHKDGKKHKRAKVHKPETPTSSNDGADRKNEKRIEDLRKKALESMGMSTLQ